MSAFEEIESRDGVRMSWNVWPSTKAGASELVVPMGIFYTPLKKSPSIKSLPYNPLSCKSPCRVILNPYCQIDVNARLWICPFCYQRNPFPSQYKDISQDNLPLEVMWENTTTEYVLNRSLIQPPLFLFVVDTATEEQDLIALRESLMIGVSLLPQNALVGLITYGAQTYVHELGYQACAKSYAFHGGKEYNSTQVYQMLDISRYSEESHQNQNGRNPDPGRSSDSRGGYNIVGRFFIPLDECEYIITSAIEQIRVDPWPVKPGERAMRCSGSSLSIALALMDIAVRNGSPARIFFFAGGPPTVGPGMVVDLELKQFMRSHNEIQKETAKYVKKATKYYADLARIASNRGIAVDLLSGCLDQVGIMEMSSLPNLTNGVIVLSDSFSTAIFKQSFLKLLDKDGDSNELQIDFNATLEVLTCKDLKICGLLGPAVSSGKGRASVSNNRIGVSGTNSWRLCSIDPATTVAIYFEPSGTQEQIPGTSGIIQFITLRYKSSGVSVLRVTTIARSWAAPKSNAVVSSFDQEVAAALISRMALARINTYPPSEVQKWVDKTLIKLCKLFADYRKEDPSSFRLPENFSIYPQFMFHFRRSSLIHVLNSSPDETAYIRHIFLRQDTKNSLIIIQPTLVAYTLDAPPRPVFLDSVSLKPDCILLLDAFLYTLIWHGETIVSWRNAGYHKMPEYENFKKLLEEPVNSSREIILNRFPIPRYIDCDKGGSQERFLMSKVNPSSSFRPEMKYMNDRNNEGVTVITEDVNLQVFMDHLRKLVVSQTQL